MNTTIVPLTYNIVLSSGGSIPLNDFSEVEDVLKKMSVAQKGAVIITINGAFNPSFFVSIVPDYNGWHKRAEYYRANNRLPDRLVSKFAKLLSKNMKMLTNEERTSVAEEVSEKERELKCK